MASSTESGHAKNVANFEKLIAGVTALGSSYNPSKSSIMVQALLTLLATANAAFTTVNSAEAAYKNAVGARDAAFSPFSKLITRVNNALKASDTTQQVNESAMTLIRKLQGRRATPKMKEDEKTALAAEGKEVVEISSSQMGYDTRLENFDKLIKLLTSVTTYVPNEEDLKVSALSVLYFYLKAKNTAVINTEISLNNARINRNDVLYTKNIGIVDISGDVKNYIKSLYGATSPQFKTMSSLKFVNYS